MADQDQLARLLEEGTEGWNIWRRRHPSVICDLSGADLHDADLTGVDPDLTGADLYDANLRKADLTRVHFRSADLRNADLSGANLSGADLRDAHLCGADLSGANLSGADLSRADLSRADLSGADLSNTFLTNANLFNASLINASLYNTSLNEANLGSARLTRVELTGSEARGAFLHNAHLPDADLRRADLTEADLSEADLSKADLSGAILNNSTLSGANLRGAHLYNADLSGADLSGADLSGADLSETILNKAHFIGAKIEWTKFMNIDLRWVNGLETVIHNGPSNIGIDTLYRSGGQIPESFLRKAGVPQSLLTIIPSLTNHANEYYTCFISYASQNKDFVKRLYNDLKANGVRCWCDFEDMKIGDKIRQRIDESIHLYDKLLLVLSEHSVASDWVQFEVETALEKEHKEQRTVLFPIRLDDHIMQSNTAWAANIRRTRHIGEFIPWQDDDAYQDGLTRLLRALQLEKPPKSHPS